MDGIVPVSADGNTPGGEMGQAMPVPAGCTLSQPHQEVCLTGGNPPPKVKPFALSTPQRNSQKGKSKLAVGRKTK